MMKFNAKELRTIDAPDEETVRNLPKNDIFIIVDNVLDTYNVGSIFRLADAVAARKVFLCGDTLTPPNSRIKKASISTWKWVDWEHTDTALHAISKLKVQSEKLTVISVEQDSRSVPFQKAEYTLPLALIVGNETYGISKEALDASDLIVELPMWGVNKSLNVMVSLGIVLYEISRNFTSKK